MSSPSLLLDCPYLPYILSLLDDPMHVLQCMLVSKTLYEVIHEHFHSMAKVKLYLRINENNKNMGRMYKQGYPKISIYGKNLCPPLKSIRSFQVDFFSEDFIVTNRGVDFSSPAHIVPSKSAISGFEEFLHKNLHKFDVQKIDFSCDRSDLSELERSEDSLINALMECVKKNNIRVDNCVLRSPFHSGLSLLLEAKDTIVNVTKEDYPSLHLLATGSSVVRAFCYARTGTPKVDPLKRIIKEWEECQRSICDLSILYLFVEPLFKNFVRMIEEFESAVTEQSEENNVLVAEIRRKCDNKPIHFQHKGSTTRLCARHTF